MMKIKMLCIATIFCSTLAHAVIVGVSVTHQQDGSNQQATRFPYNGPLTLINQATTTIMLDAITQITLANRYEDTNEVRLETSISKSGTLVGSGNTIFRFIGRPGRDRGCLETLDISSRPGEISETYSCHFSATRSGDQQRVGASHSRIIPEANGEPDLIEE
ncbi:MAG: hypothetical protein P4L31_01370 [Candidatus Babeliales bacterium]|nr:hypothetical protein [Candidatus Babeliales bacterium]